MIFSAILSAVTSSVVFVSDAVSAATFSIRSFGQVKRVLNEYVLKELILLKPVLSKLDHNDMWRWNQRVFRQRHPRLYDSFDMVGMELGEQWWSRYPNQDWRLVDRFSDQIGTYCLIPISEACFDDLIDGRKKESDIQAKDIVDKNRIHAHQYWYVANYVVTRRDTGIPEAASRYARILIIENALKLALESTDFSLKTGRDIHVVAFVEASSIERMAKEAGFQKAVLSDPLSRTFVMRISPEKATKTLQAIRREKSSLRKTLRPFRDRRLFRQPPHYGGG